MCQSSNYNAAEFSPLQADLTACFGTHRSADSRGVLARGKHAVYMSNELSKPPQQTSAFLCPL